MIRFATVAIFAALQLFSIAWAQDVAANQDVPLNEATRTILEGDWARIREQSQEAVDQAIAAYCDVGMFSVGELLLGDWKYDSSTHEKTAAVLGEAKGNLALRFNGPDDLFVAMTPKQTFNQMSFERLIEFRMDINENLTGVIFGRSSELNPQVSSPDAVQWWRRTLVIQDTTHNVTGDRYYFLSYPMSAKYESLDKYAGPETTDFYVKCP